MTFVPHVGCETDDEWSLLQKPIPKEVYCKDQEVLAWFGMLD
jgi:hypothetical protein